MKQCKVNVAIRVRPLSGKEALDNKERCVFVDPETNQVTLRNYKNFHFDYAFGETCDQNGLFSETMPNLLNELFSGYNVTVFAYGQTGSGKTFTIGGQFDMYSENKGLIVRSIDSIFEKMESSRDKYSSCVTMSYLEVYKEEIIDLLAEKKKHIYIREDYTGNSVVVGIIEKNCTTVEQVYENLRIGFENQHFAATKMNDTSSRSHTLLCLKIYQRTKFNFLQSSIHFVDLAGSERVNKTGNCGNRLKESVYINTGLLALGNVIHGLTDSKKKNNQNHIPYRQSKITRLLKDSLGGNSHTLMICCVSSSSKNSDETLNSLKYASRARHIKNSPILNFKRSASAYVGTNITENSTKLKKESESDLEKRAKTAIIINRNTQISNTCNVIYESQEKTYQKIHQENILKTKLDEKEKTIHNYITKIKQQKTLISDMALLIDDTILTKSLKLRINDSDPSNNKNSKHILATEKENVKTTNKKFKTIHLFHRYFTHKCQNNSFYPTVDSSRECYALDHNNTLINDMKSQLCEKFKCHIENKHKHEHEKVHIKQVTFVKSNDQKQFIRNSKNRNTFIKHDKDFGENSSTFKRHKNVQSSVESMTNLNLNGTLRGAKSKKKLAKIDYSYINGEGDDIMSVSSSLEQIKISQNETKQSLTSLRHQIKILGCHMNKNLPPIKAKHTSFIKSQRIDEKRKKMKIHDE